MRGLVDYCVATILVGMVLGMGPAVNADELQEVAFEDLSPHWEKVENRWRPSVSMAQNVIDALEPGQTAKIELAFRINGDGEVDNIQVVEATHGGILEEMTRDRVNQMSFRPGEENPDGTPVRVRLEDHFNRQ